MRDCLIWNELGTVYSKLGCLDEAMDAFHKAIEYDPAFGLSYSNLDLQGKFAEAISLYEKSLELLENNKEKAFTWDRLGEAYYQLGYFAKSANAYQKANELNSNHKKSVVGSSVTAPQHANSLNSLVSPPIQDSISESLIQQIQDSVDTVAEQRPLDDNTLRAEITVQHDEKKIDLDSEKDTIEQVEQSLFGGEADVELESTYAAPVPCQENTGEERPRTNGDGKYPISSKLGEVRPAMWIPWLPAYMSTIPLSGMNMHSMVSQPNSMVEELVVDNEQEKQSTDDVVQKETRAELEEDSFSESEETGLEIFVEDTQEDDPGQGSDETTADSLDENGDVLKKIEAEIERFERTTSESPNNVRAWSKLGNLYKEMNRYDEAVHAYEQASSIEPLNPDYHYRLGLVYTAQKNHSDAMLAYERTVELNPVDMLAHCALAGSYRHLGLDDKADEHVAIARASIQEENEYNRACFEAIAGNVDDAIELLTVAIENEQTTREWISVDPDLDFIREDERFQMLLFQDTEVDTTEGRSN